MGQAARPGQGHGGGAGMAVAAPGLAFPRGCILLAPVWLCCGHLPLSPSRGTSDCSLHPSSPSPGRTGAMISIFLRGSTSQQTPKLEFLSCRHTPDPSPGCSEAGVSPHPPYPVLPSPRALRGHAHAAGRPGPELEGRGGEQGDLAAGPAQGLLCEWLQCPEGGRGLGSWGEQPSSTSLMELCRPPPPQLYGDSAPCPGPGTLGEGQNPWLPLPRCATMDKWPILCGPVSSSDVPVVTECHPVYPAPPTFRHLAGLKISVLRFTAEKTNRSEPEFAGRRPEGHTHLLSQTAPEKALKCALHTARRQWSGYLKC